MQIPSRFTIAVHILTLIAQNKGNETKLTSDFMAGSVGVNPVIIRKTLSQLKKADLISVQRGTGGASLLKDPEEINLLQVYRAVDSIGPSGQLFSFHDSLYSQACQSKSRRINGGHEWEVVTGGSISLGPKPRRCSNGNGKRARKEKPGWYFKGCQGKLERSRSLIV